MFDRKPTMHKSLVSLNKIIRELKIVQDLEMNLAMQKADMAKALEADSQSHEYDSRRAGRIIKKLSTLIEDDASYDEEENDV